jgi:chaperonin GroES
MKEIPNFVYMEVKIKPFGNNVLIVKDEQKSSIHDKLFLPKKTRDLTNTGTVISVGKALLSKPNSVKPNDKVLFMDGRGDEIEVDGKEYILIKESNIESIIC